jgi:methyltransferase (TIGR00027 family)
VAALRAAHLHLFEGPRIHEDTFALPLIGLSSVDALQLSLERLSLPALRRVCAYFALRHRFSEERLLATLDRGATQVVLLGAGLDTFALRRPDIPNTVLFVEVDHPDTQRSKLERLATLGLDTRGVKYLSIDFASQNLATELEAVGVRRDKLTFFAWLGVTQYIPESATYHTLTFVGRHAAGSEVVFDVIRPFAGLAADELAISAAARALAEERGEPWVAYFEPEELASRLTTSLGFSRVTRLTPERARHYYVGQPPDVTPLSAWELMAATV